MKKVVLVTVMALIMFSHAYAQFTIGPKAGMNISTMHTGELIGDITEYKTGFNAGAFGKYTINNSFDIQAELLYSQQGYKIDIPLYDIGGNSYVDPDLKVLTHNLNIPILLKYNLLGRPWVFFEAGPQVGFLLKDKFKSKDKELEDDANKLGMGFKTVDLSIVGGIGFYLGYGVSINARYNHGLTSIHDFDYKNRVFQFSLAYNLFQF